MIAAKRNKDYMVRRLLDEGAEFNKIKGEEITILCDLT